MNNLVLRQAASRLARPRTASMLFSTLHPNVHADGVAQAHMVDRNCHVYEHDHPLKKEHLELYQEAAEKEALVKAKQHEKDHQKWLEAHRDDLIRKAQVKQEWERRKRQAMTSDGAVYRELSANFAALDRTHVHK